MQIFIGLFIALLGISYFLKDRTPDYQVGVSQAQVRAKIDLTDKLDPEILPDVLQQVFASISVKEKPESEAFQQEVVQRFSRLVLEDPNINYRVDLNEDGVVDPLMVVPESVEGRAAVYSLRVPDPEHFPQDPTGNVDWNQVSKKQSIELVEVAVTVDPNAKQVSIASTPNQHLYENTPSNTHYTQNYNQSSGINWIQTYFQYQLFSSILFGPYGWGFGPFYGGFYGGYYRPYPTASRNYQSRNSRYAKANRSNQALKTTNGQTVRGSRSATRGSTPSKSIQSMKSKRDLAVRKQNTSRQGGFGSSINRSSGTYQRSGGFGRSRTSAFSGGGSRGGWGK
jgi:hypothetical protein